MMRLKITAIFCAGMNARTTTTWAQNNLRTNVVNVRGINVKQTLGDSRLTAPFARVFERLS